jgi:RNase P subunit RPR2
MQTQSTPKFISRFLEQTTIAHVCKKCRFVHTSFPSNAKVKLVGDELDGVYFNCRCGGTCVILFITQ